ncbi:sulfur carrier protein ThiS [Fibrobacter sp. HC4]|uniref:sulfur carrier protein ThiS n=1 Tax=Fibrobacter sp. HC4 TaxID=3239812 RepID=UPI0031FE52DE|nr:Sulfur carrier protein ThiS [Fibrobacter succinogenes]
MIKVNGIDVDTDGKSFVGKSVAEYLSTTNFDCKRIAVERNGDIVPKAKYTETLLADGDSLEVVSFVGGG